MSVVPLEPGDRVRHLKTGGTYAVLMHALLEATREPAVVYRSDETGQVWVRIAAEMHDGRFVKI